MHAGRIPARAKIRVMEQENKPRLDLTTKVFAILGFFLALGSLSWQIYTYRDTHEESPMVRGSLTQEVGEKFNRDRHGMLTIKVTNLGKQKMQIKSITLSAFKRVWVLPVSNEGAFSLEPGRTLSHQIQWDYVKYPIFELDESQPADFVVEVETTKAVHQQHVWINSINVTSTVPEVAPKK